MSVSIAWADIDTVLLDMDGTLLDLYFDNYFWLQHLPNVYAQKNALSPDQAKAHLITRFAKEQGTLNWYCVDYWSQEFQIDIAAQKAEIAHFIQERPNAYLFLHTLKTSGRRLYLVTNAHHKSLALKLNHTPLADFFDEIICSHDFNMPKEAHDFWPSLQKKYPFDPARSLFIDDSESVLVSAQHFGIAHLYSIAQPDLKNHTQRHSQFPAIHDFNDLFPIPARV